MNRTIKAATVNRFHHETRDKLRTHLADFQSVWYLARPLKTVSCPTSCDYICKVPPQRRIEPSDERD